MFEQAFKNIDDVLWKEAGCTTELDYTEQTSWLLFLKYLDGLEQDKAAEMQRIIDAENSDIFDVLAHVAYAVPPVTREVRAAYARLYGFSRFSEKQKTFLDFVLQHYVNVGVEELDQEKLTPLLRLRYNDSIADLGRPEEIGSLFAGFQKYLYQQQAAA